MYFIENNQAFFSVSVLVLIALELDQIAKKYGSWIRRLPISLPHFHTYNNNLAQKIRSRCFCRGSKRIHSLLINVPYWPILDYCFDWIVRWCLVQRNSQHLLEKCPNPFCHLDQTKVSRRLGLRVESPTPYPIVLFGLMYQYWDWVLHANRIFGLEPLLSMANNQTVQWSISIHSNFHIF